VNDPHVAAVIYAVGADGATKYENASPLAVEHHLGRIVIKDDKLRFEPKRHFATEQEAIEAVGPFLQAWEAHAALQARVPGLLRFRFEKAEIIDRNPLPPDPSNPEPVRVQLRAKLSIRGEIGIVTPSQTLHAYPPPPTAFQCSPEFDDAFARWRHYKSGLDSLQGASYYILSILERSSQSTNQRRAAAAKYAIDYKVLSKVGELVSERGDATTARKFVQVDLTPDERHWLAEATLLMIRRLGESAAGDALTTVTLQQLPPLP
jgi:hypothetical protein